MAAGRNNRIPSPLRYAALASDYDGTIATEGRVPPAVRDALATLKQSGRALLLVTGRIRTELEEVFPLLDLFDRVVLENGAVLFHPETGEERPLAPRPPDAFFERLRNLGVMPLIRGRVIVATRQPHETTVLEVIRDLGLSMHIELNRNSVMALPAGVTKATGLDAALRELSLSAADVVGVGDADNDRAFLERCGFAVGVANALPSLRERVDWVTRAPEGAGVVEVVRHLMMNDLGSPRRFPKEMSS
jgi:hydroxymethylpyrimidine pyrophosphatase-like HAD family hydrolase